MGKVMFSVCPHLGGGVPISHNALQHFPECHGAGHWGGTLPGPAGEGYPARSSWGGYPARSNWGWGTLPGPARGGTQVRYPPSQGTTPWPGYPPTRVPPGQVSWGVPWWGGYLTWVPPTRVPPARVPPPPGYPPGGEYPVGVPRSGQHREYLLHGGRYASCVHVGGLSCLSITSQGEIKVENQTPFLWLSLPFLLVSSSSVPSLFVLLLGFYQRIVVSLQFSEDRNSNLVKWYLFKLILIFNHRNV